jgi:HK97 family phage portal protein
VFSCVDRLARGAAGVPLVLYRAAGGKEAKGRLLEGLKGMNAIQRTRELKAAIARKEVEEIQAHPLLRLLAKPNDLYGGAALIESLIAYRAIAGNSYLEAVGPDRRPPTELYSHRPDRVKLVTGNSQEPIRGYEYSVNGQTKRIERARMLHWKTFNPLDDWYGMPPLVAASRSVDMNNAGRAWNVSLMQNSARPSGLVVLKGLSAPPATVSENAKEPTKNPVQRMIDEIKNWAGAANAGRVGILGVPKEGDISWQQTAFTPLECSWMEGLGLSAREICVVLNVPSLLVGDVAAKTYANYAEARKALYQDGIFPLLDLLVSDLNNWLCPMYGDGLFLGYDTDKVDAVQEDRNKAHERSRKNWESGLLRHDEARAAIGYGEDPNIGQKYIWEVMPNRAPAKEKEPAKGEEE